MAMGRLLRRLCLSSTMVKPYRHAIGSQSGPLSASSQRSTLSSLRYSERVSPAACQACVSVCVKSVAAVLCCCTPQKHADQMFEISF